jgi:hypothetical protein
VLYFVTGWSIINCIGDAKRNIKTEETLKVSVVKRLWIFPVMYVIFLVACSVGLFVAMERDMTKFQSQLTLRQQAPKRQPIQPELPAERTKKDRKENGAVDDYAEMRMIGM